MEFNPLSRMNPPPPPPPPMRQGKGPNVFKKYWDKGHDPSKPYKETKDKDGNIVRTKPTSHTFSICEMADEELGDFLNEDEMKALRVARKQRKESEGRDICEEMRCCKEKEEKEAKERVETLTQRNKLLEEHARQQEAKHKKMEKDLDKLASLVAQLMNK